MSRRLRRAWRREQRAWKRRTCAKCGYPARMHLDQRRIRGLDDPAWRLVPDGHSFVEADKTEANQSFDAESVSGGTKTKFGEADDAE